MTEEKPKGFFPTENLMSYSYSTSLATSESEEARRLFAQVGTKKVQVKWNIHIVQKLR